jgi:hypothetical protein
MWCTTQTCKMLGNFELILTRNATFFLEKQSDTALCPQPMTRSTYHKRKDACMIIVADVLLLSATAELQRWPKDGTRMELENSMMEDDISCMHKLLAGHVYKHFASWKHRMNRHDEYLVNNRRPCMVLRGTYLAHPLQLIGVKAISKHHLGLSRC